jgi:D-alanyl-lipoteichoic acid acyltransferase DltB (MBOAT superfamily)
MLFNTLRFFIFFTIVFALYLRLNHRWQNRLLLAASYIFYGAWDATFLILLVVSTMLDYICGLEIFRSSSPARRKAFLWLSMCGNLGLLGFFKYYNFFAGNLQRLLAQMGWDVASPYLDIVLPVGISFYTFQTMSYTIDVYRGQLKPARDVFSFALYVTFFPQLVAGPIERAASLLPQVLHPRTVTWQRFSYGAFLIFWGLFQKVFVADNLARIVDPVFARSAPYNGAQVLVAVYAFTIQIFCDFAGYSIMARGLGQCLGFDLMVNFRYPYFATNPRELWQRWHISLSTWIRDYPFKAFGGYAQGSGRALRNLFLTFGLAGLWHGANWTFVAWGIFHGLLLVSYVLLRPILSRIPEPVNRGAASLWLGLRIIGFYHLWCLGALIFRAQSITQAGDMFLSLLFQFRPDAAVVGPMLYDFVFYSWIVIGIQYLEFRSREVDVMIRWPVWARSLFYFSCFYLLLMFGVQGGKQFYYFQF